MSEPQNEPANDVPEETGDDVWPEHWPHWAPGAVVAMRRVPSLARAAESVGVARTTLQRLQAKDVKFADAIAAAREEALDTLEEICLLRARTGQPVKKTVTKTNDKGEVVERTTTEENHVSDLLAMFYLKRWRPEYRDSYRVEHSGPDGGPVQIEMEEKLREAVGHFDAEVVRLADVRAARDAAGTNGV